MATMRDVNEVTNALLGAGRGYRVTNAQARVINARITALGYAIQEEQGCAPGQIVELPDDTVLGPKAEAAFRAFQDLLPH